MTYVANINEAENQRPAWADPVIPDNPPAEPWMKPAAGAMILAAVGLLVFTGVGIAQAPSEVPLHFDLFGRADRYGSPKEMWIVSGLFASMTAIVFLAWRPAGSVNIGSKAPTTKAGWRAVFRAVRVTIFLLVALVLLIGYLLVLNTLYLDGVSIVFGILVALLIVVSAYPYLVLRKVRKTETASHRELRAPRRRA